MIPKPNQYKQKYRKSIFRLIGFGLILVIIGSCQTMKQVGKTVDRTVKGKSVDTKGIESALARDAEQITKELNELKREFEKVLAKFKGDIKKRWGKEEIKVAKRTVYVKYTQDYRCRAVVDFDHGTVMVESLDEQDPKGSLKSAIVTTLLTPINPQGVDLFSDRNIPLSEGKQPYLLGLVLDESGRPINDMEQAERYAASLIKKQMKIRTIPTENENRTAHYVKILMVANFESKKAEKYKDSVIRYAGQYKISPSLVFAVIRTESNFNPYAVSSVPAYGLMQLVPSSGGRAAYRRAKGSDKAPSREYLFVPEQNIELGTAYLNVLNYNELEKISNPISREYCVISAYNTGPGNVLRTFSRNSTEAFKEINSMDPEALYEQLISSLPYRETRRYLPKVLLYRKQFAAISAEEKL
ncbi:MAG: murein transglycosylase domain-containing protein [Spirochaetota bacterium]